MSRFLAGWILSIVILCYVLCVCEGIKKIKQKLKKERKKNRISIFKQGYEVLNLKVQKIQLFLDWLINTCFDLPKKFKPIFTNVQQ